MGMRRYKLSGTPSTAAEVLMEFELTEFSIYLPADIHRHSSEFDRYRAWPPKLATPYFKSMGS